MIRVFHCDDSESFRMLLREQLDGDEDVELVGEAAEPAEAVAGVGAAQPDVVLLDLLAPDEADRLLRELREAAPGARIVVYSGFPPQAAEEARAGADAYLQKSAPFSEVRQAILDAGRP